MSEQLKKTIKLFIISLVFLNGLHGCQKQQKIAEFSGVEIETCSSYQQYKKIDDFFLLKSGKVSHIELFFDQQGLKKKIRLNLNDKPRPRIQTLEFFTTSDEKIPLPIEWRNLAGLAPLEVFDFFEKLFSLNKQELLFIELPGFGGRKILWKKVASVVTCSSI